MTVLDAILWVQAAIQEIKDSCVLKCFQKAGFNFDEPVSECIPEQQSDYDYPSNDSPMAKLPPHMQASDYDEIDIDLSTEETSDDISNFIAEVPEEVTDDEDAEKEVESDAGTPSNVTNYQTAIKSISDLTSFAALNGDTDALHHLSKLRLHFEKAAITSSSLKQTSIKSFFKT
ncbi:hypothetical protein ACFE04_008357 [Oxalis oulophora]